MLSAADRALRKGRITSSTAAAALGLSSWTSPLQAWCEIRDELDAETDDEDEEKKKDEEKPEPDDEDEMLAQHERGHFLEPALLDWARYRVSRDMGLDLEVVRPPTVVHPHEPWAADSVDGLLRPPKFLGVRPDVAALEAKSVAGGLDDWGEVGTAQVPAYCEIQARWHCWVHDVPVCFVPMIGPRLAMGLYIVRRDAEIEAALVETLEDWWSYHVRDGHQPEATGADERTLKRLFPKHRPDSLLPDDPALAMLARRDVELREALKAAKTERSAVRAEIQDRLRTAEGCKGEDYSISWRASKDGTRIDYKAIVAELLDPSDPDDAQLIEKHTRVRPGPRVLRTTWRGK